MKKHRNVHCRLYLNIITITTHRSYMHATDKSKFIQVLTNNTNSCKYLSLMLTMYDEAELSNTNIITCLDSLLCFVCRTSGLFTS